METSLIYFFLQERYIILRTKNDSIMEIVISVIIVIIAVCYIANRVKKQEQAQKHASPRLSRQRNLCQGCPRLFLQGKRSSS